MNLILIKQNEEYERLLEEFKDGSFGCTKKSPPLSITLSPPDILSEGSPIEDFWKLLKNIFYKII